MRARTLILDAGRRVVSGDVEGFAAGDPVTPGAWLGESVLEAVARAEVSGHGEVMATDSARGTHWIIEATTFGEPWRARVDVLDVTAAIEADRDTIVSRLAHDLRNTCFALQAVLDAITTDRPTGDALETYLAHLRSPSERLRTLLNVLPSGPKPRSVREQVRVADVVELAIAASRARPVDVTIADRAMIVSADADALRDAVVAMIDSGPSAATPSIAVQREGGRARFAVEHAAPPNDERALAALWDVTGGRNIVAQLRLARARETAIAHDGDVGVERTATGVRLVLRVPALSDGSTAERRAAPQGAGR